MFLMCLHYLFMPAAILATFTISHWMRARHALQGPIKHLTGNPLAFHASLERIHQVVAQLAQPAHLDSSAPNVPQDAKMQLLERPVPTPGCLRARPALPARTQMWRELLRALCVWLSRGSTRQEWVSLHALFVLRGHFRHKMDKHFVELVNQESTPSSTRIKATQHAILVGSGHFTTLHFCLLCRAKTALLAVSRVRLARRNVFLANKAPMA